MISPYSLCNEVDDNAPIVIEGMTEEWKLIEQVWSHIPVKVYI